jgi:Zn-dependent metalloprotease
MKNFITLLSVMTVLILSSVYASNTQDAAQTKAIKRLEAASKDVVKIEFDQRTNIPRFVNLRVPVSGPLTAEASAYQFFEEYQELFKMSNPAEELAVKNVQTDRLGMTHVRMRQSINGIPVFGREVIVHINNNHEIYAINGEFFPGVKVESTTPAISSEIAISAAKSDIGPAVYRWDTELEQMLPEGKSWRPAAELMIYEHVKQFRLVYRTMIAIEEPEPANWIYFIDAKTGEVLRRYNDLKTADAVGTGNSLYRGTVSINTNQAGSTFELKDNPRNLWTYDGRTGQSFLELFLRMRITFGAMAQNPTARVLP